MGEGKLWAGARAKRACARNVDRDTERLQLQLITTVERIKMIDVQKGTSRWNHVTPTRRRRPR